jgi:hypothetical protein
VRPGGDGELVFENDVVRDIMSPTRATLGTTAAWARFCAWSNGYVCSELVPPLPWEAIRSSHEDWVGDTLRSFIDLKARTREPPPTG